MTNHIEEQIHLRNKGSMFIILYGIIFPRHEIVTLNKMYRNSWHHFDLLIGSDISNEFFVDKKLKLSDFWNEWNDLKIPISSVEFCYARNIELRIFCTYFRKLLVSFSLLISFPKYNHFPKFFYIFGIINLSASYQEFHH